MPDNVKDDSSPAGSPLTILVAEDDPDDRELIADAFKTIDSSSILHMVPDGRSALNYLYQVSDQELPCLIVLDYNMPEINGAAVLERICNEERFQAIPKVILSTSNSSKYVQECLNKGAHAYRVKPDNFSGLVRVAKEMLDLCHNTA